LRSFSMHPTQILAVKQEVLRADAARLAPWAQRVISADEPALAITEPVPPMASSGAPRDSGPAPLGAG
ncbi:MAG: phosphoenolpyruvate--protein phosphotransferase, partial [Rhodoferax sp.]|nr:phosphoenolpyruvate--protein phosphotransferase [Rhodoferax sp.]